MVTVLRLSNLFAFCNVHNVRNHWICRSVFEVKKRKWKISSFPVVDSNWLAAVDVLKGVPHVKQDYSSAFSQSNYCSLVLPLKRLWNVTGRANLSGSNSLLPKNDFSSVNISVNFRCNGTCCGSTSEHSVSGPKPKTNRQTKAALGSSLHYDWPVSLGSLRSTTRLQRRRHKICILN